MKASFFLKESFFCSCKVSSEGQTQVAAPCPAHPAHSACGDRLSTEGLYSAALGEGSPPEGAPLGLASPAAPWAGDAGE